MKSGLPSLKISIRELHARTGHYVRKAARQRVIITSHGKPSAELTALTVGEEEVPYFARRKLLPAYEKFLREGRYNRGPNDREITEIISEDRNDRV